MMATNKQKAISSALTLFLSKLGCAEYNTNEISLCHGHKEFLSQHCMAAASHFSFHFVPNFLDGQILSWHKRQVERSLSKGCWDTS